WMHVAKLTQEQCKHHDASNYGQLRWLKIDRPKVEPTARTVNLRSHHLGQDEKEEAEHVHRRCAPDDPAVINQGGDHEREKAHYDPVGLFAPKIRGDRILPR